jgi:hypothetical protein
VELVRQIDARCDTAAADFVLVERSRTADGVRSRSGMNEVRKNPHPASTTWWTNRQQKNGCALRHGQAASHARSFMVVVPLFVIVLIGNNDTDTRGMFLLRTSLWIRAR